DPSSWSVIVTGGSSGLGAAVCRHLAKQGASVVALDRRSGEDVTTIEVDLSDTAAATAATRAAIERLGTVDAVVCCAGTDVPGALGDVDAETWDRIVGVNLLGTAAVIRA